MKKVIKFIIPLILISCSYDKDDRIEVEQQIPEDYESTETVFNPQESVVYYTGSNECLGNGEYSFDEDKVLDELVIPSDLPEEFDLSRTFTSNWKSRKSRFLRFLGSNLLFKIISRKN